MLFHHSIYIYIDSLSLNCNYPVATIIHYYSLLSLNLLSIIIHHYPGSYQRLKPLLTIDNILTKPLVTIEVINDSILY